MVGVENPGAPKAGGISSQIAPVIGIALTDAEGYKIRSRHVGYIQTLDPNVLLTVAREKDLVPVVMWIGSLSLDNIFAEIIGE